MKGKERKGKVQKAPLESTSRWFTNVAKSLGFATQDIVREMIPSMYEFAEENVNAYREVVSDIRDNSMSERMVNRVMDQTSPMIKLVNKGIENVLEDIKTGNFYNQQRDDELTAYYDKKADEEMFGSSGGGGGFDDEDFGFGDDFGGDDDFNEDDIFVDDSKNDAKPAVQPVAVVNQVNQQPNLMPVAKAISNSNVASTTATLQMMQGTAKQEKTFEIQRVLRDTEFRNTLFGVLGAINNNLSQMVIFQSDSTSKLVGGALSFFGEQIDLTKQIMESVKGDERTPEQIRDDERAKNTDSKKKEDIFLSEGGLDMNAYFKNVVDNFKHLEELEDVFDMTSVFFDSDEEDMMRMVTQPLKFIPQAVVKSFIPQVAQDSIALVDETFSAFTSGLMAKLNAWGENEDDDSMAGMIKSLIGRTLGYKQENKTSADLGKYEKGPVPFDGITRRTITDVIPTYLRRIESAITNTNERVYDYDSGTFKNLEDMIRTAKDAESDQEQSGQSTVRIYIDRAISRLKMNKEDEDSFKEEVNDYFKAMNNGQKMINPFIYRNTMGEEVDELDDNQLFLDPDNRDLFRTILGGLDKKDIMKMVGENVFKSVKNRNRFYEEIEKDNTLHGYRYAHDKSFISKDYDEDPSTKKLTRKSVFKQLDSFGKTTVDYVRDIRSILLHGIDVFIAGGRRNSAPTASEREEFFSGMNEKVGKEEQFKADKKRTETDKFVRENEGKRDISDINKMTQSEILGIIDFQDSDSERREYNWMQSLNMSDGGRISQLKQKLADKVIELTDKPTKAINDFLYKLMFGSDEDDGQDFDSYFDMAKTKLSAFHSWAINNVYTPVKDALIGPEGLVTKLKDSKFVKAITDKKNMLLNKLLGEKDLEGNRTGGLLATFRNASVDLFKGVKHYFTGESYKTSDGGTVAEDDDAVFRRVKRGVEDGMTRIKRILFGDDKTGDKGVVVNIGKTLIDGINNFRRSMFGEASMHGWKNTDRQKSMEDLAEQIAKRAPKALGRGLLIGIGNNILFSQAGILGSMFLPGGPIGGILVGTGVSLLLESDRFKNWLFGEKDPDNIDRRLGGVIPKGMQDFYHDNKKTINMGGLLGAGFGLLPAFFLPGGPLTGAILGIGAGLLAKSDMFQRFLYGDDFENGDKKLKNGAIGKAFDKAKNWMNKELNIDVKQAAFLGTVGGLAGAMGLLPSFFLPGGPIGGAILGVGAGIIASSNKFQTWLFGEEGFDGKRSGGLIDKFKTWFDIEIFDSLKITVKEWGLKISDFFQENIAEPFLSALDPMKNIVMDAVDGVKSIIKAGWNKLNDSVISVFKDNVIKPFGESLTKYVVDPLKKLLKTSFGILGKIVGTVLSAPFRLLGLLGGRVDRKVKKGKASDKEKEQRQKYHDAKEERQKKREERRQKVQEDIDAMKEKQTKDREFFKRDGRFRNQEAKEKWETQQREKEMWYQQHIAESGAETAERLENIDKAISDMMKMQPNVFKSHEQKLFDELQKLREKLAEQLDYWKERGFTDTRYMRRDESKEQKPFEKPQDPFFMFNNTKSEEDKPKTDFKYDMSERIKMTDPNRNVFKDAATEEAKKHQDPKINEIVDLLRRKGQSHAEGLDEVPYDGYVAELHEGEKIVPANKDNRDRMSEKQAKQKQAWYKAIRKHTKTIADEVKGQLYGVGSNLHQIRKILQHSFGLKDEEVEKIEDKNIKDYGFFGKLFNKVKNNITTPFSFIKDTIMKPVDWVKEKIGNVVDTVEGAIGKVVNTIGKVVDSLIAVPGKIINATVDVASTVLKGGAQVLVKGLEMGLKATETVVSDLYKGTRFLVTSIAKSFVPALVGAGKLVGNVLQGLGTAGKFAIETVIGLGKGMYTVTKDVLGFGYNLTKDTIKGVAHVGKTIFKGGLNLVKGALTGLKNVVKGGFGLVGGALGLIKSKVTGKKEGVQQVQVVGGNLDVVDYVGAVEDILRVSNVDRVIGVNKVDALTKIDKDVNVRIRTKEEQSNIRMQRARDLMGGKRVNMNESEDSVLRRFKLGDNREDNKDDVSIGHKNKNDATNNIKNGEINPQQPKEKSNTEKGKEKQSYEKQIKEQTEQTKKEKKQEEKEAEAKKDKEHVSRLTSDYVQEQKKKKKEEKLDRQYKVETMKDIDSSEKIANKQYKFWQNLLGKNGIVHTKLSSIWAWLLKVAPMALAWFKGTKIAGLLGSIFGGTGFAGALKGVLAALAPAFIALFIDNLDKWKRDERADKYNLSDENAYLGVGDEKRYDAETGEYILNHDRKDAKNKVIKNTVRDVAKNGKVQKLASATRNVARNARPYVSRVGSKIGGAASKAKGTFGRFVSKMGSKFGRKGSDVVRNGMSSTLNSGTIEILDEAGETVFKGSKYSITDVKGLGKATYIVEKFVKLLRKAVTSVISFVGGKLGNNKLVKAAGKIMQPLLSKFSGSMLGKIASKFGSKITAFIAKKGAGAATFFILDAAFAVWDIGTGQTKSETANLFGVNQDDVNATMRTISAALKAITNFSIIGVINLANEISSELLGFNFLRSLACCIYKHVAGNEKNAELEKNQKALEAELQQYNQEHGTKLSKEAYLDKKNPSVASKIMNNSWVKNFKSAFDKGDAANALGKDKDDVTMWDRVKFFGGHTANTFLNLFRSKENKRTDSEFMIGKTLVRGENGLPVLDENGNPMYEEDIKAGKVTSDGKVQKEGANTKSQKSKTSKSKSTDNTAELTKKYGGSAGTGDMPTGGEADYQDITANFDSKATDANTWLESKAHDQSTLMQTIGSGFDTIKRVFFRWYSGDSKDTDRLVSKAGDKLNLHDNRIWRHFGAFNWLTNLFQKDADKLTENSELDTLSTFFDNTSKSIGAWILNKMNDAKALLARIQSGFNGLTGSTLSIFGKDIKLGDNTNNNSNNSNKKLNFGDIVKRGIKAGINTMVSANPVVGAFKAIGSGIGKLFGYAQGTPWVPDTQLALIHQGEMIVPAEHNPLNPENKEKYNEFKYDVDKDTDNILNSNLPVMQNDVDNKIVRDEKVTVGEEDSTKVKKNGSFALDLLKAYRRITVDNLKITSTKTMDVNLNEGATLNINGIENISDEIIDAIQSKIDDKIKDGSFVIKGNEDDEHDTEDDTSKKDNKSHKGHKKSDSGSSSSSDDASDSGDDYSSSSSEDSSSSSDSGSSSSSEDSSSSDSGSSSSSGGSYSSSDGGLSSSSGGKAKSKKRKTKIDKKKERTKKSIETYLPKDTDGKIISGDPLQQHGYYSSSYYMKKNKLLRKDPVTQHGLVTSEYLRKENEKKEQEKKEKDKNKPNTLFQAIRNMDKTFNNFNKSLNRAGNGNTINTLDSGKKLEDDGAVKWLNKHVWSPIANFDKSLKRAGNGNTLNTLDSGKKLKNGETTKWLGGIFNTVKRAGSNVAGGFKEWHEKDSKKTNESAKYIKDEAVKAGKSAISFGGTIFNNLKSGFTDWYNAENKKNKENLKTIRDESHRLYTQDDDKAKKYADAVRGDKKGNANFFSRLGYQLSKPITNVYDFFMPKNEKLKSGNPKGLTYEGGAIVQGKLLNKEFVKPVQTGIQALKNVAGGFKEWHEKDSKKTNESLKYIKDEAIKAGKSAKDFGKTIFGNVAGGFKEWHEKDSKKTNESLKYIKNEAIKAGKSAKDFGSTVFGNVAGGFKEWHEKDSKKTRESMNYIKDEAVKAKNKAGDWINKNIFTHIRNFDKKGNEKIDQVKKDAKREKNAIGNWLNNSVFKSIQNFDKKGNEKIDQVKKDAKREQKTIGNWIDKNIFSHIRNFDKKGNEKIDQVKKDAKREKNDIGNWINKNIFSHIQNFDKKGNEKIEGVKKDAKREQKDMNNWFNKVQDSAGKWVNKTKTSLLSSISDNLFDDETSTGKQSERDKKAKEASRKRSKEARDLHKKLTEGYEHLKESAGNWADETKNYIVDQYNKNISLPLNKSSKQLQKQFAQLSKSTTGWLESAKESVVSSWNKSKVGKTVGSIVGGAKKLINNVTKNDSSHKNLKDNTKTPDKNQKPKKKNLIDKVKDAANKAGNWIKDTGGKIWGGIQHGASNFYHKWLGKGESDTTPLKAQIKPKNYIFKDDEYKYTGSDKGKKDGGLRDKGNTHNFPFYSQLDKRWGADKLIGGESIGRAGCGPTAAAMVLTHLTGERITPDTMARVGADNLPGYANYKYFPEIAAKFKLNYSEIDDTNTSALKSALRSGKPVILSGFDPNNSNSSPFTNEGHIVVATGVKSNEIEINDPRGPAYSGSYSTSDVLKGLKKGIVLEATKATKEVALPSIEHLENVYYDQDYTMSEDLPDIESGLEDESLGEAGKIKLWQKVLGYARAFKGKLKYSYGSSAIDNDGMSTDCSAFTSHVFKRAAGISLPRNSTAQGSSGSGVSSPLPADLVVWNGHVGIVSDTNGNMVDCGSGTVAKERSYTSNYWRSRQNKKFRRVLSNRDEMVDPTVSNYHKKIGFNGVVDPNANGGSSGGSGAPVTLDKYLFVGDSMLGNLKASLESDSSSVQVRYKVGKTAKYWLDNFSQMPDKDKVSNVVSWIGVNGILNANNYKQTEELMNKLASKYGKAVHPMAVFPVGEKYKEGSANASNMNPAIKEFNSKLQSYASSKGSTYIDATSGFVDDKGYLKGSADNLHISGKANNDKIVQNVKSALGLGSSGSSGDASGGGGESIPELGVFDKLSNGMSNVIASMYNGEQVDLFSGSGGSSDGGTAVTGSGDFPKYQLNDSQIKGLANIIDHEQPGPEGKYAEASIMANLTDIGGDSNATTPNLINKAKTWFAHGDSRFSNPGSPTSTAINAVKDVIVGGKRTLPRYVNEHDCFSDLTSVTNDGKAITKTNRSQYKQHVTKIKNRYGASGTFWGFPNSQSDPFYYTSDANRKKWGENCYSVGGASSSTTTDDSAGNGDLDIQTFDIPNYDQFDFGESAGFGLDRPAKYPSNVDFLPTDRPMTESELVEKFGESAGADGGSGTSPGGIPYTKNNYAYLNQYDKAWKRTIGGMDFSSRGCGPTTLAIIATQLTGKLFNPSDIAKAAYPTHWRANGAQWSLFPWFGNKFGMKWNIVPCNDLKKAKSELKAGHPIAVSGRTVRKGPHTPYTGGHIVPFVGLDSNNKIIVNDPQATKKAIAYEDSGLANGNVNTLRQGWAYIPPAKVPSDIKPIGDYNGSTGSVTNMTTGGGDTSTDGTSSGDSSAPEIPELGIFDKLSNGVSNIIASMYNGQQVDLFASSGSSDTSSSDSSSSGGTTDVHGADVAEQIYNYSKGRGASNAAAAGVVGNAERESNLNPKIVAHDGSLGLFQWLMAEDQKGLKSLASKEGKEWSDVGVQMKYLWDDLENQNDFNSLRFDKRCGDGSKGSGLKAWKAFTSPEKAASMFERCYEVSAETTKKREQFARKWYDKFNGAGSGYGPEQFVPHSQAFKIGTDSVYYDQTDPQWNTDSYGGNTVAESGCGPTSLAMIASQLTGEEITPDIVAKAAYMDGVWSDSASWNLFPWFARQLGLEYSIAEENDLNTVDNMLGMGEKVVASGILQGETKIKSPFTTYGHIVPFVKKTNAGYLINDPRGKKYVGVYKPNEIVNRNSIMRKAWGYKTNPEILKYLKDSKLNPDLYKDKKEIEDATIDLGPGSKHYTASELYENAGLGSKKKSFGKVIDKLGKMTGKYKNVVHTYKPDDEKTIENKKSSKSNLETFMERLNRLTKLTSSITDRMYYEKNTKDTIVEPEEEAGFVTASKNITDTISPKLDIKDIQEKVTRPIKEIQLDALEKLKRIANKISENSSKINNTTDMTYVKECVEQLTAAVKELESINTNTKATAENVSKIQVYSENYPVSQIKDERINDKVSKLRQSKPNRQTNRIDNANSDEYKIARMIASFDK